MEDELKAIAEEVVSGLKHCRQKAVLVFAPLDYSSRTGPFICVVCKPEPAFITHPVLWDFNPIP
jgi:hypothetical protein